MEQENGQDTAPGESSEPRRPPLPPRPTDLRLLGVEPGASRSSRPPTRGHAGGATTSLSMMDVNSYIRADGSRELRTSQARMPSSASIRLATSNKTSEAGDDSFSIRSFFPTSRPTEDAESIFGDGIQDEKEATWGIDHVDMLGNVLQEEDDVDFEAEFKELEYSAEDEEQVNALWRAKRKHYLILSAAGKPIYTRHGSDSIISNYVGIVQTIISFYNSVDNALRSFTAGDVQFVILSQTNLFLVAITTLPESEAQLRVQLEALYMQILSTLTLPTLTHLFSVRPSTDLRRPLEGTERLLSSLADTFTRGSPSTLLSALESLKIRKSHRQVINATMVKARADELLYGLIVAGGRLVSVLRPKKHSLHPSDLQLIFNMLFEAEAVKAGGGDSWIPICLPGFNKTGYLYMYVSFLDMGGESVRELNVDEHIAKEDAVAIILLSADKESFESMQSVKSYLVHELRRNRSMQVIQSAVRNGRPTVTDIVPGSVLRHFLYKSKGNVQFFMPSYSPHFETLNQRRKLMSVYHTLHASVHAKHATVKVHHSVSASASALAWSTPMFELYCVAGPNAPRNALAQSANKVVQWVQREEERIFLIGGAVF